LVQFCTIIVILKNYCLYHNIDPYPPPENDGQEGLEDTDIKGEILEPEMTLEEGGDPGLPIYLCQNCPRKFHKMRALEKHQQVGRHSFDFDCSLVMKPRSLIKQCPGIPDVLNCDTGLWFSKAEKLKKNFPSINIFTMKQCGIN
jgi:hypothetical protein